MEEYEQIIQQRSPKAQKIEFIEHGYHNIVAIVDEAEVFHFPRDDQACHWMFVEAAVLQELADKLSKIPKTLHVSNDPPYSIQSYLPGEHLTPQQFGQLDEDKQMKVAAELAQFIVDYGRLISPEKLKEIRQKSGMEHKGTFDETWEKYLKRMLAENSYSGHPEIEKLAKEYYQKWLDAKASDNLPKIVLHDDLHLHNLLFVDGELSGILDFGDSAVGTATEEMRNFYILGDDFLNAAIEKYASLTGQKVDPEKVRIWAITTSLATLCKRLENDMLDSAGFKRASDNLRKWLPGFSL